MKKYLSLSLLTAASLNATLHYSINYKLAKHQPADMVAIVEKTTQEVERDITFANGITETFKEDEITERTLHKSPQEALRFAMHYTVDNLDIYTIARKKGAQATTHDVLQTINDLLYANTITKHLLSSIAGAIGGLVSWQVIKKFSDNKFITFGTTAGTAAVSWYLVNQVNNKISLKVPHVLNYILDNKEIKDTQDRNLLRSIKQLMAKNKTNRQVYQALSRLIEKVEVLEVQSDIDETTVS